MEQSKNGNNVIGSEQTSAIIMSERLATTITSDSALSADFLLQVENNAGEKKYADTFRELVKKNADTIEKILGYHPKVDEFSDITLRSATRGALQDILSKDPKRYVAIVRKGRQGGGRRGVAIMQKAQGMEPMTDEEKDIMNEIGNNPEGYKKGSVWNIIKIKAELDKQTGGDRNPITIQHYMRNHFTKTKRVIINREDHIEEIEGLQKLFEEYYTTGEKLAVKHMTEELNKLYNHDRTPGAVSKYIGDRYHPKWKEKIENSYIKKIEEIAKATEPIYKKIEKHPDMSDTTKAIFKHDVKNVKDNVPIIIELIRKDSLNKELTENTIIKRQKQLVDTETSLAEYCKIYNNQKPKLYPIDLKISLNEIKDELSLDNTYKKYIQEADIKFDIDADQKINFCIGATYGIFRNLIKNAIKAISEQQRTIRNNNQSTKIDIFMEGNKIYFHNYGAIPKLVREKGIFNLKTTSTGTGIGLYSAETWITRLGGSIDFASNEQDGTTFVVTLPESLMLNKDSSDEIIELKKKIETLYKKKFGEIDRLAATLNKKLKEDLDMSKKIRRILGHDIGNIRACSQGMERTISNYNKDQLEDTMIKLEKRIVDAEKSVVEYYQLYDDKEPKLYPIDLQTSLDEITEWLHLDKTYQKYIQKADIKFKIDADQKINFCVGATYGIFRNLIKNAIKTVAQQQENIKNNNQSNQINIFIKDNQIHFHNYGVIPERLKNETLFGLGTKGTGTGTGIGLYSAKTWITRLGGSIDFRSNEQDGTTFIVTLPEKLMLKQEGET